MPREQGQAPERDPLQCPQSGVALPDTFLYLCHLSVHQHPLCACYSQAGGQRHTDSSPGSRKGTAARAAFLWQLPAPKPSACIPVVLWRLLESQKMLRGMEETGTSTAWVLSATFDLPPLGNPCGQISTTDGERENHLQSRLEVQRGGKTTFIITAITIINTTFLPQPHAKQSPALPLSPYPTRQEERVTLQTIVTQPAKPTQLLPFDHKSRQINICHPLITSRFVI